MSTLNGNGARPSTLLNGTLVLGDVADAEKLVRKIANDRLRYWGAYLNPTEYDDLLSFLLAEAWRLYERYDPDRGGLAFSTFCHRILWRRVACWYRQRFGDSRHRKAPEWVSLDDSDLDTVVADWEWYEDERLDRIGGGLPEYELLTPDSRRIYREIAVPMALHDLTKEEVADRFGYSRRWVSRCLDQLRVEILELRKEESCKT